MKRSTVIMSMTGMALSFAPAQYWEFKDLCVNSNPASRNKRGKFKPRTRGKKRN